MFRHIRNEYFTVINRSSYRFLCTVIIYSVYIMLNFYKPTNIFWIFIVGLVASLSVSHNTHYYTNLLDISYRLWLNDFVFNSYYFYWTSFWYLSIVISLLKLLLTFLYIRSYAPYYIFILYSLIVYALVLCDYWSYVFIPSVNLVWESQINSLLTNSINKYHPFIFYLSLVQVYIIWVLFISTKTKTRFISSYTKLLVSQKLSLCSSMILFTLSLGSWWALQEGSWGGWWNWDSSEVFGLLVMLIYVQLSHQIILKTTGNYIKLILVYATGFLLLTYILIQLNFDLVSHNFGTKITQFVSSDQFFYLLSCIVIYCILLITHSVKNASNNYLQFIKSKPILIKIIMLSFIVVISVLLSFSELLNNFYWLLFGFNFVNVLNLTTYYSPITLITLYIVLLRVNIFSVIAYTLLICNGEYFIVFLMTFIKRNVTYVLHVYIYIFIFLSYLLLNQTLTHWSSLYENKHSFILTLLLDNYTFFVKLNTSYIECCFTELTNNQFTDIGWSFIQKNTNLESHAFQHSLNSVLTLQGLISSWFEYIHSILVIDYSSQIISTIITLILFVTLRFSYKHILIMF